jgi:hypothetical protein
MMTDDRPDDRLDRVHRSSVDSTNPRKLVIMSAGINTMHSMHSM